MKNLFSIACLGFLLVSAPLAQSKDASLRLNQANSKSLSELTSKLFLMGDAMSSGSEDGSNGTVVTFDDLTFDSNLTDEVAASRKLSSIHFTWYSFIFYSESVRYSSQTW